MKTANNVYRIPFPFMSLANLRHQRGMSQKQMADILGADRIPNTLAGQGDSQISVTVSSLQAAIEAMGGELIITAHFPDGSFRISGCEGTDEPY